MPTGEPKPAPDQAAPPLRRLPGGHHGLPREYVAQNQRERLMAALAATVAERGYAATTVQHITEAAGVSRRTLYEHFRGKEDCFLTTFEIVLDQLAERMITAAGEHEDWPHQVRAAIAAGLGFLASEPEVARLVLIEYANVGELAEQRYRQFLDRFAELLRASRPRGPGYREPPEGTEEVLLGGSAALVTRAVNNGRVHQLEQLLPDLVTYVMVPYLGISKAERFAREPS